MLPILSQCIFLFWLLKYNATIYKYILNCIITKINRYWLSAEWSAGRYIYLNQSNKRRVYQIKGAKIVTFLFRITKLSSKCTTVVLLLWVQNKIQYNDVVISEGGIIIIQECSLKESILSLFLPLIMTALTRT